MRDLFHREFDAEIEKLGVVKIGTCGGTVMFAELAGDGSKSCLPDVLKLPAKMPRREQLDEIKNFFGD